MKKKSFLTITGLLAVVVIVVLSFHLFSPGDPIRWESLELKQSIQKIKKVNKLEKILFLNEIYSNYETCLPGEFQATNASFGTIQRPIKKFTADLSTLTVTVTNGEQILKKKGLLLGGEEAVIDLAHVGSMIKENRLDILELNVLVLEKSDLKVVIKNKGEKTAQPFYHDQLLPEGEGVFKTITVPIPDTQSVEKIWLQIRGMKKDSPMRIKMMGIHLLNRNFKVLEGMPHDDDFLYGASHLRSMKAVHLRSGSFITYSLLTGKSSDKDSVIMIDGYLGSLEQRPVTIKIHADGKQYLALEVTKKVPYFRLKIPSKNGKIHLAISVNGDSQGVGVLANVSIYRPFEPSTNKNVLYYLVDSLRADKGGIQDPILSRHFKKGAVFTAAYANATRTADSLPTIFSGKYKFMLVKKDSDVPEVEEDEFLLAEYFKSKGYVTAAFINNPWLDKSNCSQGFDFVDTCYGRGIEDSPFLSDEDYIQLKYGNMEGHIKQFVHRQGKKPLFIYVHTMEPHIPYEPPDSQRHYSANADKQLLKLMYDCFTKSPVEPTLKDPTPKQMGVLMGLYKDQVLQANKFFTNVKDHLESTGVLNVSSMTILTADHGERFYEHRSWIHGPPDVYNEVLRIPIMIAAPGIKPGVYDRKVQLVDMYPTIQEWLGDSPSEYCVGNSLLSYIGEDGKSDALMNRVIYSDGTSDKGELHFSFIQGDVKVIVKGAKIEIYHLGEDAGEKNNRANDPQYRELITQAQSYRRQFKRLKKVHTKKRRTMSEAERQHLKTLGYIR